ncbi:hypothetical protein [Chromobacterium haemolyticum]|uniref:Phage tail protein n=1 Tax=Chromobacterium haemolyticum TaxID=394935 RepID=A0A1W0D5L7_9NEIS|nr:hypothetical protein [Chromobacterium haemolyticum]OQS42335.1 hypothetical protein B0T45_05985 [Chromobacterium haemolyticum]
MPLNGYTVGNDTSVDIVDPYGGPINLAKIINFEAKPKTNSVEVTALNGQTDEMLIPKGWSGTFEVERTDSTLEDFWARWESDYYNGAPQLPSAATITDTTLENNGSRTTYRFTKVQLKLESAGKREGGKTVRMQVSFTAQRRLKV